MFPKLWKLLTPFHRAFYQLILMAVFYETGGVLISYTVPFVVRLFSDNVQKDIWFLVVIAMLGWNEAYMRLDNQFDWHIAGRLYHPIYKFLKLNAIAKFLRMPLVWQQHHDSGTLVGQVIDGIWRGLDIISMIAWEFMPTTVQTVISLIPMFIFSPYVALLSLVTMAIFVWLTLIGEQAKKPIRKERQDVSEKDWSVSVSSVQAIETVITFGLKQFMMDRLNQIQDQYQDLANKENHRGIFTDNRRRIRVLTTVRLIIYGIWVVQLYQHAIDVPSLIFLSVLMERLFSSYWKFARLADRVYGNSESVMRLIKLLEEPEPVETGHQSVQVTSPVDIVLDHVCLAYNDQYTARNGALHDLSLNFEAGKVTALVGPSGAGKSTVIAALMKLFEIHHGHILVAGLDIRDWDSSKLLEMIAHVPPGDKVYLWDESFAFNIRVAKPSATEVEVIAAASHAGIHDFIAGQDKGYATVIGERGVKLSSGQKQRLAIARAILRGSPIVILDEPTSAVDSQTEHLLQANLKKMLPGRTAIIVAHRLSTIRDADWIFVLEDGRKTEEGTHHELVALGGLYARMVALQTSSEKLD